MRYIIYLFLCSFSVYSQEYQIVDAISMESVPYANIWFTGTQQGFTSNQKGVFKLPKQHKTDSLSISSLGYKSKSILVKNIPKIIKLTPSIESLETVELLLAKKENTYTIGIASKKMLRDGYGCSKRPWMIGRWVKDSLFHTPKFLESIEIPTRSRVKDAKFKVHLYQVNDQNSLEYSLHDEPIYGYAKKGKALTIINLSHLNIQIPKNGLLVILEFMVIERNKHEVKLSYEDSNKKKILPFYQPSFAKTDTFDADDLFYRSIGSEIKDKIISLKKIPELQEYLKQMGLPAMKITVTD